MPPKKFEATFGYQWGRIGEGYEWGQDQGGLPVGAGSGRASSGGRIREGYEWGQDQGGLRVGAGSGRATSGGRIREDYEWGQDQGGLPVGAGSGRATSGGRIRTVKFVHTLGRISFCLHHVHAVYSPHITANSPNPDSTSILYGHSGRHFK
ncbi:hypothetical protein Bbelb_189880 [Branchiostoma belcheri]|nr:hypothetical protein Bbelb_189880 [Branchiostoma belcheri]